MKSNGDAQYFPFSIQIVKSMWESLDLMAVAGDVQSSRIPRVMFFRQLAERLNLRPGHTGQPVKAGLLNLYALYLKVLRYLVDIYTEEQNPGVLEDALMAAGYRCGSEELARLLESFGDYFPCGDLLSGAAANPSVWLAGDGPGHGREKLGVKELLLLNSARENPALASFRALLDDSELAALSSYSHAIAGLERELSKASPLAPFGLSLPELLRAPCKAAPDSLERQMEFIRNNWGAILPPELLAELATAFVVLAEEARMFAMRGEPGGAQILEFLKGGRLGRGGSDYPEDERFSPDADWMANVVMLAKMSYVWLDQLSRKYRCPIHRLDQVPDEEIDILARWGFTGLWLIGLWERSPASQRVKQIAGNPDAISSAYSLYDYVIAGDLGGEEALQNLKERCRQRGIRLASDMVPNHTGIYSKWTLEHPDWFVQLDYPPYPSYSFNGPDLSFSPEISLTIEDGYWDKRDAAVVFKHHDHRDGRTRYIYHGNDGTSTPWNDTAQLNYLLPAVREAVIQTILHVARQFPIIRFDAAMTLAKRHYQRLWYPQPGHGGVPSRAEHGMSREEFDAAFPEEFWRQVVDRVAAEAPDTLLLAEAFWLMEGYFVRTLGMHRVYNSAFMNMLKMEENVKYRQTIKNVLEYDHRILPRFVNFMSNPDEKTAVEQFGKEGKYFGACVLLVTMPGLPMIGHGQIEGFHEKYGMEYRRAYWDESVDEHMVRLHEEKIFPLMGRRPLFSGSENFVFYDFFAGGTVDENVFAYSNRKGSELGIILYHNRFAETAGWIRTSTAIAEKDGKGETLLVQKTLGEALGFNADGRSYYTFRDYATGLDYVRAGRELCQKGLFVELEAFEYHAFLDFREIVDDDYGSWGQLCHLLGGRPVASLDEELKQVRFKGVIDLLRELLALQPELYPPPGDADVKSLQEQYSGLLTAFFTALAEHAGGRDDVMGIVAAVCSEYAVAGMLARPEAGVPQAKMAMGPVQELLQGRVGRLVFFAYLCLHRTGLLLEKTEFPAVSAELCHRFGLLRGVEEALSAVPPEELPTVPGLDGAGALLLLRVMLVEQRFLAELTEAGREKALRRFVSEPLVARFLLVHRSGAADWFNRERFELLMSWLLLAAMIEAGTVAAGEKALSAEAAALLQTMTGLVAAAEEAGYRVDRLLVNTASDALI